MNKETFAEIYALNQKGVTWLFNELQICNMHLTAEISTNSEKLYYSAIQPHLEKSIVLADFIAKKSIFEREEFFMTEAKFFCEYVKTEDYEEAAKSRTDLVYFRKCFLKDSALRKTRISPDNLTKILEEEKFEKP